MATAPAPKDVQDFNFKLLCSLRIFPGGKRLERNSPLKFVTSGSKYGVVFVGSPRGIVCINLVSITSIQNERANNRGTITTYPRRDLDLGTFPTHLDVSSDGELLAVVIIQHDIPVLIVYSIASFGMPTVVAKGTVRLSSTPGVTVVDLKWNPGVPNMIGSVMSDGSVRVDEIKADNTITFNSLPPSANARSLCWSPKGKQVVVGDRSGALTQHKPELQTVKTCPPPGNNTQLEVVSVHWISSFQFIAAYKDKTDPSARASVFVVNVPKNSTPNYINYEDVCFGTDTKRPEHYFIHVAPWNLMMIGTGNGLEVTVLSQDGDAWRQWLQDEACRAELPLTEDHEYVFNVGMALDFSSQQNIPLNESRILPPMPQLIMMSDEGVLSIFNCINAIPTAVNLCKPPSPLMEQFFTVVEIKPIPEAQQVDQQPKLCPAQEPVPQQTPPRQALLPTPQEPQKGFSFGQQTQPSFLPPQGFSPQQVVQSQSVPSLGSGFPKTTLPPATSQPSIFQAVQQQAQPSPMSSQIGFDQMSTFGQSMPANLSKAPTTSPAFSLAQQPPPSTVAPQSTFTLKPEVKQVTAPVSSSSAPAIATPTSSTTQEPSRVLHPKKVKMQEEAAHYAAMMKEFHSITQDVTNWKKAYSKINFSVDTTKLNNLSIFIDGLEKFEKDLKETTLAEQMEVNLLRCSLVEACGWLENIKAKMRQTKSESYVETLESKELDPVTKKNMKSINQYMHYLDSQINYATVQLDILWSSHKGAGAKGGFDIPNMEAIYQSIAVLNHILAAHTYRVNELQTQMQYVLKIFQKKVPQLLNDSLTSKTYGWNDSFDTSSDEKQLERLANKLLLTKISKNDEKPAVSYRETACRYIVMVNSKRNIAPNKENGLQRWSKRHTIIRTKVVRPCVPENELSRCLSKSIADLSAVTLNSSTSPLPVSSVEMPLKNVAASKPMSRSIFTSSSVNSQQFVTNSIGGKGEGVVSPAGLPNVDSSKSTFSFSELNTSGKTLFQVPAQPPAQKPDTKAPQVTNPPAEVKPASNLSPFGTVGLHTSKSQPNFPTFGSGAPGQIPSNTTQPRTLFSSPSGSSNIFDASKSLTQVNSSQASFTFKVDSSQSSSFVESSKPSSSTETISTASNVSVATSTPVSKDKVPTSNIFGVANPALSQPFTFDTNKPTSVAGSTAPTAVTTSSLTWANQNLSNIFSQSPVSSSSAPYLFSGASTTTTSAGTKPSTAATTSASFSSLFSDVLFTGAPSTQSVPIFGNGSGATVVAPAASTSTPASSAISSPSSKASTVMNFTGATVLPTSGSNFGFGGSDSNISSQGTTLFGTNTKSIFSGAAKTPSIFGGVPIVSEATSSSPADSVSTSTSTSSLFSTKLPPSSTSLTSSLVSSSTSIFSGTQPSVPSSTNLLASSIFEGAPAVQPTTIQPKDSTVSESAQQQQLSQQQIQSPQQSQPQQQPQPSQQHQQIPQQQHQVPQQQQQVPQQQQQVPQQQQQAPQQQQQVPQQQQPPQQPSLQQQQVPQQQQQVPQHSQQQVPQQQPPQQVPQAQPEQQGASIFGTPAKSTAPSPSSSVFSSSSSSQPVFASATQSATPFSFSPQKTTASIFGGTAPTSTFGTQTTSNPDFGVASALSSTSFFNSPTSTTSTSAFGNSTPSGGNIFGKAVSTFASPTATTTASTFFGQAICSPNVSTPSNSFSFGQGFQSPTSTTSAASIFSGGGASSPSVFGQPAPVFGSTSPSGAFGTSGGSIFDSSRSFAQTPSMFPSPQGQTGSIFGGTSPNAGGGGSFTSGQSLSQTGFGGAGFGTSPGSSGIVFGGQHSFGSAPTFGGSASFGSPNKIFGSPTSGSSSFGTANQQQSTFETLAGQNTVTFGNLAQNQSSGFMSNDMFNSHQQQQQPFVNKSTFGGNSFSTWR